MKLVDISCFERVLKRVPVREVFLAAILVVCILLHGQAAALAVPADSGQGQKYGALILNPIGGFDSIHANGLNNLGQVVGSLDSTNNQTHAFVWEKGVLTDLGTFGGEKSIASGINDAGDIVGIILTRGERHAFLRHHRKVLDLGVIDTFAKLGLEGNTYYCPRIAINSLSQVTGHFAAGNGDPRSFLLTGGHSAYFGLLGNGSIFYAESSNRRGQILGRATCRDGPMRSMLWQAGRVIDLASLNSAVSTATAINDHGMVVGWLVATNGTRGKEVGFVWEQGKVQLLNGGNAERSRAYAVNNHGDVVGAAWTAQIGFFACLWIKHQIFDLNDLAGMESGWHLVSATAINDQGQILAVAANGRAQRPCLLSPLYSFPSSSSGDVVIAPGMSENNVEAIASLNLTRLERLASGAFRLGFNGTADGKYIVEASTDLVTWTALGASINAGGALEFTDPDASRFTMRFYRLMLVP